MIRTVLSKVPIFLVMKFLPVKRLSFTFYVRNELLMNLTLKRKEGFYRLNSRNVTGRVRKYDGCLTSPMFVRRISMYSPSSAS